MHSLSGFAHQQCGESAGYGTQKPEYEKTNAVNDNIALVQIAAQHNQSIRVYQAENDANRDASHQERWPEYGHQQPAHAENCFIQFDIAH